jgi:GT2 family glycosyltransferase
MTCKTSVFIPSYNRPGHLLRCLESLAAQTLLPDEVLVVLQEEDGVTKDAVEGFLKRSPFRLEVIYNSERGIVSSENLALSRAAGDIICLIDDDAVAPKNWLSRHLSFYRDSRVGAVGGPADNYFPDGHLYPRHAKTPVGRLSWYGRLDGNMYDHPADWRQRPSAEVDHLVGYNLTVRREAFRSFEQRLKPYWQLFELDLCCQVRSRGYKVMFDFGNTVEHHHPGQSAYSGGRDGDLTLKIYNGAYNQAFVFSKHTRGLARPVRLGYLLLVGSMANPGLAAFIISAVKYRAPVREAGIFFTTARCVLQGWRDGRK